MKIFTSNCWCIKIWLIICCFWFSNMVLAQVVAPKQMPDVAMYVEKYPDSKNIILAKNEFLDIEISDDGEWDINRKVGFQQLVLDDANMSSTKEEISYGVFTEIKNLKPLTLIPVGNNRKAKKIPVKDITTQDVLVDGLFYSGYKAKSFSYPQVQAGAIMQYNYTEKINDPRLINYFNLAYYYPIEKASYTISVPNNVSIKYHLLYADTIDVQFTKTHKNNKTIYKWEVENVDKLPFEDSAPSAQWFSPQIIPYITEAQLPNGQAVEVLRNPASLYKWYRKLVNEKERIAPSKEITALAQQLKDADNDKASTARNIFKWVQNNIKYIAMYEGLGGLVPNNASEIYTRRYGDCKDMSTLLLALLRAADIPAQYTWIGTRALPYKYNDLPIPYIDNHMIVATQLQGETLFLDATGKYEAFGMPTDMIQGKQALVSVNDTSYKIKEVPIIPAESNKAQYSLQLNITDTGNVLGTGTVTYTGYRKANNNYFLKRAKANGTEHKFFERLLQSESNNFELQSIDTLYFKENNDLPAQVRYSFLLPNHAKKVGEKIYVNPNIYQPLSHINIDSKKRKLAFEVDFKQAIEILTDINLPEGYTIENLPANSTYKHPLFSYTISYKKLANSSTIRCKYSVILIFRNLHYHVFADWICFLSSLNHDSCLP